MSEKEYRHSLLPLHLNNVDIDTVFTTLFYGGNVFDINSLRAFSNPLIGHESLFSFVATEDEFECEVKFCEYHYSFNNVLSFIENNKNNTEPQDFSNLYDYFKYIVYLTNKYKDNARFLRIIKFAYNLYIVVTPTVFLKKKHLITTHPKSFIKSLIKQIQVLKSLLKKPYPDWLKEYISYHVQYLQAVSIIFTVPTYDDWLQIIRVTQSHPQIPNSYLYPTYMLSFSILFWDFIGRKEVFSDRVIDMYKTNPNSLYNNCPLLTILLNTCLSIYPFQLQHTNQYMGTLHPEKPLTMAAYDCRYTAFPIITEGRGIIFNII